MATDTIPSVSQGGATLAALRRGEDQVQKASVLAKPTTASRGSLQAEMPIREQGLKLAPASKVLLSYSQKLNTFFLDLALFRCGFTTPII